MFNHPILDVFIGLSFIYLLYSLFTSIIQESIAKWLSLRARMLLKSIARMLEEEKPYNSGTFIGFFADHISNLVHFFKPYKNRRLTEAFYKHQFIKHLGEGKRRSRPSYINADTFSKTIIYLLRNNDHIEQDVNKIRDAIDKNLNETNSITLGGKELKIPEDTLKHIQLLWNDANKSIDQFKIKIENWYNNTQDRVVGWYTRQTQTVLFTLGLIIAVTFNIDTIALFKILSKNSAARHEISELAKDFVNNKKTKQYTMPLSSADSLLSVTTQDKEDKVLADIDTLNARAIRLINEDLNNVNAYLGIGWQEKAPCKGFSKYQPNKLLAVIGWILTALALSLGSTFWFDLLKRILKVRSSGINPDDKKDGSNK
jgi:hypothetical protein